MTDFQEFRQLFWLARKAHVQTGKTATDECPEHNAALAYAQTHGLQWAECLLRASLLTCQGKPDEALEILSSPETTVPGSEMGIVWFLRGVAFRRKGDDDSAIDAYAKAVADPDFDTPGKAWLNLGLVFAGKGDNDKAIEAYEKALADSPQGTVWYLIGQAYHRKGDDDSAIDAYYKALEDPHFDGSGDVWWRIGWICAHKGAYDKAIEAYERALAVPDFGTPGQVWHNLGWVHHRRGAYRKAIKAYKEALKGPKLPTTSMSIIGMARAYIESDNKAKARELLQGLLGKGHDETVVSTAKSILALLDSELEKQALSSDDAALLDPALAIAEETPENRIVAKMRAAHGTKYDKYLEKKGSDRDNVLTILRGWSSSVTLLEGSQGLWRGGGYFLKWRGKGIVIDPGFDFLRNFHDTGYHGREISAVLVSHNHSYHNGDLRGIDDLRYEMYKRRTMDRHGGIDPYVLLWDEDTRDAVRFSASEPQHQHRPIIFDVGRCTLLTPCSTIPQPHGLPFSVEYFRVAHDPDLEGTVGFTLLLHQDDGTSFRLGYTGDTKYSNELSERLKGCDVLVAHISEPGDKEMFDPGVKETGHLGYRGLANLIKNCKPKATIVSEFWAGRADFRIDLVKGLRELTRNPQILPASIGMHVLLPGIEVECTSCQERIPFGDVRVSSPANQYGNLGYLCPRCVL